MESVWQDARFTLRTLAGSPGFVVVAVLTVALGIGGTSAIFSLVNALLLRPFAFENPDRLAWVWEQAPGVGVERGMVSPANFLDLREQSQAFDDLVAFRAWDATLDGSRRPEHLQGFLVSADFFRLLRKAAAQGRTFYSDEAEPGKGRVAVLSYGVWQNRFGADPSVVGREIVVDDRGVTVVGVMPQDFSFPPSAEIWAPLLLTSEQWSDRQARNLQALGRLAPGVSLDVARAEMAELGGRLERVYPEANSGRTVRVVRLAEGLLDHVSSRLLWLTLAAAMVVLLVVCANLAGMLLAKAAARGREFTTRLALGASRSRLAQQLLIESTVLAVIGGIFGLLLAQVCIDVIMQSVPPTVTRYVPGWNVIGLNARVIWFALVVAVGSGVVFGVAPCAHVSGIELAGSLRGGRTSTDQPRDRRVQRSFVVSEMAMALVLVTGTFLLASAFSRLAHSNHGFDPRNVLTLRLSLPSEGYGTPQEVEHLFSRLLDGVRNLPGVIEAGAVSALPWHVGAVKAEVTGEGRAPSPAEERFPVEYRVVSTGYFAGVGTTVLNGRPFAERDDAQSPPVVIVSETLARRFWPNESALGRRLKWGPLVSDAPWLSVVGVVADVKRFALDRQTTPTVYVPYRQAPERTMSLVIRTAPDPMSMLAAAEREVYVQDGALAVFHVETLDQSVAESLTGVHLAGRIMGAFAALAMILSAIGIYGLTDYAVERRRREISVRVALGASRNSVFGTILAEGARLVVIAIAVGIPASLALSHVMESVLFGVESANPVVLLAIPLPLIAVSLTALLVPARKAARIGPLLALRQD